MLRKIFLVIVFTFFSGIVFSQVRRYSNDFLNIGVSAKSVAMGNSVVACVSDYSALYYNPSLLIGLKHKYEVGLMHSSLMSGLVNYDFIGTSYKMDDSTTVAAGFIRLGVDDIQNTLYIYDANGNVNYDNIRYFSVSDNALFFSVGRNTAVSGLAVGATVKIIFRNEGEFAKAYGISTDIAMSYKTGKWKLGAILQNATTGITAWFVNVSDSMQVVFEQTGNALPKNTLELTMPVLTFGVARSFDISNSFLLNVSSSLMFTFDGRRNALVSFNPVSLYPQLGIELSYKKIAYLRLGSDNFQLLPDFSVSDTTSNYFRPKNLDFRPSAGVGVVYRGLGIDYALSGFSGLTIGGFSHVFSLFYKF